MELAKLCYRDMFDNNPDLKFSVIKEEMSDKLLSIVDNYTPLPSTTSCINACFELKFKIITL